MPQPTCLVWTSCIRSSSSARSSLSWVWCSLRVSLSTCISSPSRRTLSLSRSDCNFSTTLILMHYGINHTEIRIIHLPLLLHQNTLHCIYMGQWLARTHAPVTSCTFVPLVFLLQPLLLQIILRHTSTLLEVSLGDGKGLEQFLHSLQCPL